MLTWFVRRFDQGRPHYEQQELPASLMLWPSAEARLSFMPKKAQEKRKTEKTVTKDDNSHLVVCRFCREE